METNSHFLKISDSENSGAKKISNKTATCIWLCILSAQLNLDENDGVLVVPIRGQNMYIGAEIYDDHG